MSAAQHTPGPWAAKPTGHWDGWDGWSVEDAGGSPVCDAHGSQHGGVREANARLIAAAPELLDVLQRVRSKAGDAWSEEWLELVDGVISKATGEAS